MRSSLVLVLSSVALLQSGCIASRHLDLFEQAQAEPSPGAPRADTEVLRSRYVNEPSAGLFSGPERLRVTFFDDARYEFARTHLVRRGKQDITWIGTLEEAGLEQAASGYLALLVRRGLLVAHAHVRGRHFRVMTSPLGLLRIEECAASALTCGYDLRDLGPPSAAEFRLALTIDVMVLYTEDVRNAVGSMACFGALAELVIDETNEILGDSNVRHRLRLVHTMLVDMDESDHETMEDHKLWLKDAMEDSEDEVAVARNEFEADIVSLVVKDGHDWCGMARGIGVDEAHAGHVVDYDCLDDWVIAHETGHLMGGRHDVYRDETGTPFAYGHGFILSDGMPSGAWVRTIMAYDEYCTAHDEECPTLPIFSNPDITIFGHPLGDPADADVARVWNERGYAVSRFR